jgi:uncharacterized repeat protein (TIGR02543 family)
MLLGVLIPQFAMADSEQENPVPEVDALDVGTLALGGSDFSGGWINDGYKPDRTINFGVSYPMGFSINLPTVEQNYSLTITYPNVFVATPRNNEHPEGQIGNGVVGGTGVYGTNNTVTYQISSAGTSTGIYTTINLDFVLNDAGHVFQGMDGDYTKITATLTGDDGTDISKDISSTLDLGSQYLSAMFLDPATNQDSTLQRDGTAREMTLAIRGQGYPGNVKDSTITIDFNNATVDKAGNPSLSDYLSGKGLTLDTAFAFEKGTGFNGSGTITWSGGILTITYPNIVGLQTNAYSYNIPVKITTSSSLNEDFHINFPNSSTVITGNHNGFFPGEATADVNKSSSIPSTLVTMNLFDMYLAPRGAAWEFDTFYNAKSSYINRYLNTSQPLLRAYVDQFNPDTKDVSVKINITDGELAGATTIDKIRFNKTAGKIGLYPGDKVKYTDSKGSNVEVVLSPTAETYWTLPKALTEGDWFTVTFEHIEKMAYSKLWRPIHPMGSGAGTFTDCPALFETWGKVNAPTGNGVLSYLEGRVYTNLNESPLPEYVSGDALGLEFNRVPIIVGERVSQDYRVTVEEISTSPDSGFGSSISDLEPSSDIYIKGNNTIVWENGCTYRINHDPVIIFDLPAYILAPTDVSAKNPDGTFKNLIATDSQDNTIKPTSVTLLKDAQGRAIKGHNGGNVVAVSFKGQTFGTGTSPADVNDNTVNVVLKTQLSESATGNIALARSDSKAVIIATSDWEHAGRNSWYWPYDDSASVFHSYSEPSYDIYGSQRSEYLGSVSATANYLTDSTWVPAAISGAGYHSSGVNSITVSSTPAARLDVSVDVSNTKAYDNPTPLPYDPNAYRSYNGSSSSAPTMNEKMAGNFRIRLFNSYDSAMTGATEAYFVLPQNEDSNGWSATAGGELTERVNTVGDIEVWYSTDAIRRSAANLTTVRGLSWTKYESGGNLPGGITALKFVGAPIVNGGEYISTFEFTTPDVDVKTVENNKLAVGKTLYDLGQIGSTNITSENGRTAAVSLTRPEYTVLYNANDGSDPADTYAESDNPFNGTEVVKVVGNDITRFSRQHYLFNGWNTEADGSGKSYSKNNNITLENSDVVLYAQWKLVEYKVTYNGNGSTSGTMTQATVKHGKDYTIATNKYKKTDYTFKGWATSTDGKVKYQSGDKIENVTANLKLFAVWKKNPPAPVPVAKYSITYHGNGHTSGTEPARLTLEKGSAWVVSDAGSLAKEGYSFIGWSTAAEGTVTHNANQAVPNITGHINLYAVWQQNELPPPPPQVDTYQVSYNANGATSGSVPTDGNAYEAGSRATLLGNSGGLARTGYSFLGWAGSASATSAAYTGGERLAITGNVTLYAVWESNITTTTTTTTPNPTPTPAPAPPVVAEPAEPESSTFSPAVQQRLEAQTGNIITDLANGNVPLGGLTAEGAWSLLSGIISIAGVILSIILAVGALTGRRRTGIDTYGDDETRRRGGKILRILTCIVGVVTLIVWIVLEDFTQPMIWVNNWTMLVAAIFIVQIALLVVYKVRSTGRDTSEKSIA